MKIYRAVKTNLVTQNFGQNLSPIYVKVGMLAHNGYDWLTRRGEKVYWDVDTRGVVLNTEVDMKGGLGVSIVSKDDQRMYKHRYWHLKSFSVEAGDILESGDEIGIADNTGYSTSSHLHRDICQINTDHRILNYKNGYRGRIKMDKWFTNEFIRDHLKKQEKTISILTQMVGLYNTLIKLLIIKKKKIT